MPSGIRKNQYSTDGILVRSILGGIIGDIAGSTREGYGSNTPYPTKILTANSYFTDDSALTIAVADWLNNKDNATLKSVEPRYFYQVQAQLMCTGLKSADFVCFCPFLKHPIHIVRITADEEVQNEIAYRISEAEKIIESILK